MENVIGVGLGEIVISDNPLDVLVAYGLGSCLGIGVYDPSKKMAGLLHAVLPERSSGNTPGIAKYVDTGIRELYDRITGAGGNRDTVILRMAGGANMLMAAALSKSFDIGNRNIASAHATFAGMHLRLAAEDVGGTTGRTVRLYVASGRMTVRVIGGQEKDL